MTDRNTTKRLKKQIFLFFPPVIITMGLLLFWSAGSFWYWEAWLLMVTIFLPCTFVVFYFLKHDPALLERRMRLKEKEYEQKLIIKLFGVFSLAGFLMPGFDRRYDWSHVPVWLVILSDVVIFLGYLLIFFVFKENTYTSRIIEVEKGQKVISTGPYAVVRHPMYAGLLLMFFFIPLALGSSWAPLPFLPIFALVIARMVHEEKILRRDLPGYEEYVKKIRYRLVPGIW